MIAARGADGASAPGMLLTEVEKVAAAVRLHSSTKGNANCATSAGAHEHVERTLTNPLSSPIGDFDQRGVLRALEAEAER